MSSPAEAQDKRRIDRVLSGTYLVDIATLPLAELRARRDDAEQEEVNLSYVRRLLQGRLDIVRAELDRRAGRRGDVLTALPEILSESTRAAPRGLGRHADREPSHPEAARRRGEALLSGGELTDLTARSVEELQAAVPAYEAEERRQSDQRSAVQRVVDACNAEIARRYRDGEASVADLLPH